MTTISRLMRPGDRGDAAARVLLVEDDEELREGLAETLRLNGMTVAETGSGSAFRSALRSDSFDVAVVDVNLPDADGFELARELSGVPRRPGIILLTARTGRRDRVKGYADGADLYMTKPADGEELALAVRNMARRIRGADATGHAAAEPAAWRLDVPGGRLFAPDGTAVPLSGREVLLLQQFAKAEGGPVSRSELGEIMGYGSPGPKNRGLDAALRRLRRKASENGVALPVQVIQSIGVRFTSPLHLA